MDEPEQLRRGKLFEKAVQKDWEETAGGQPWIEHTIPLLKGVTRTGRRRHGRMDIFVDELGDMVTVVEIKATDWDRVLPRNRQKNLASRDNGAQGTNRGLSERVWLAGSLVLRLKEHEANVRRSHHQGWMPPLLAAKTGASNEEEPVSAYRPAG